MLPKKQRLNRNDFEHIYESGNSVQTDIGYAKFAHLDKTNVACVVSKDELTNSVDRTRARRRAYGVVEDYFTQIPDGVSIIWFLSDSALTVDIMEIEKSFKDIIDHIQQTID
jgi:ribonuclease P protein component